MNTSPERGPGIFFSDLKLIPNLLCIYRIIAIYVAVAILYAGYPMPALVLGITAGLTDYLDGYLARKWNQATELGALLDGMADILFAFIALLLAVDKDLWPMYIFVAWAIRDIGVTFLRASAAQMGFAIRSMFLAKVAANMYFYSFIVMAIDYAKPFGLGDTATNIHYLGLAMIHAAIVMQWISGLGYLKNYIEEYRPIVDGAVKESTAD